MASITSGSLNTHTHYPTGNSYASPITPAGAIRISPLTGDYEVYDGTQWCYMTQPKPKMSPEEYKLKQVLAWLDEQHPEIIFELLMRDTICQDDLPRSAKSSSSSVK